MTNNSSIGPKDYLKKLQNLGLPATAENILTSCEASVMMLEDMGVESQIYLLGTKAFGRFLKTQGYHNNDKNPELSDYFTLIFQRDIDGTKNTCIKNKYLNMLDAGHASKQSINTNNQLIIWELVKNSILAYNEFHKFRLKRLNDS